MCGLAGALASNPVDVVRTRMMNQRGGALYQGTLDCVLQVRHNPQNGENKHPTLVPVQIVFVDDYVKEALHHQVTHYGCYAAHENSCIMLSVALEGENNSR